MVREKFTTPKVDPNRTVAFTGYRPRKILESLARLKRKYPLSTVHHVVNERLKTLIHTLYREGYDTYMTGMADGFDVWAAMAVLELQAELHHLQLIAVPAYIKNVSNDTGYNRMYAQIMAAASQICPAAQRYSQGCFDLRNEILISNCTTVVCYYDGLPGGTANTLSKARRRDLRIINVCLNTMGLTFNNKANPMEYLSRG